MYTTKSDTFGRLIEDWIEAGADGLKETTRAAYATVTQAHIFPALGEMPTADVTAEHVSTLMCSKTDTLAPATMRIIAAVLRGALHFAQVEGSVSEECASAITATRSSRRTEVRSLSRTEQAALEKVLVGTDPSRLGVLLTLYTGLRIGELCALRWGDLSLEDRTVRVSRCVQRIRRRSGGETKTELYFGSPKSINSARCIPMPSKVASLLRHIESEPDDYFLSCGKKLLNRAHCNTGLSLI